MPKLVKSTIQPEALSVDDCEILSGRSKWSWRKDAYSGKVASYKIGRRLLIPMAEVRRIMDEGFRPRAEHV